MGYWQKESEFGKKVGCFKAPLGSLGLIFLCVEMIVFLNSIGTILQL